MKRTLILKLPPFFPCRLGEEKRAAISRQACYSQNRVRSYIVLALGCRKSTTNLSVSLSGHRTKAVEGHTDEAIASLSIDTYGLQTVTLLNTVLPLIMSHL